MMKEVEGGRIKEVVMSKESTIEVEESGVKAKYMISRDFSNKWIVKLFFYGGYELLGYFDELRVLELVKYSKFRYSDNAVALFQHLLNCLDSIPLFLKVYEEKGDAINASTLSN